MQVSYLTFYLFDSITSSVETLRGLYDPLPNGVTCCRTNVDKNVRWSIISHGKYHKIKHKSSGKCLAYDLVSRMIYGEKCDPDSTHQLWSFEEIAKINASSP